MPMYDFRCENGHTFDAFVPVGTIDHPCRCCSLVAGQVWVSNPPAVIGDACDFVQENGFATPQRFTSKAERRRALKEAGMEEMVRHVGVPGTDKSPHTAMWSAISQDTLDGAARMLERVGKGNVDPPTEEEIDAAVERGEVGVLVPVGGGRSVGLRIGRVYSGVLDPATLKGDQ